MNKLALSVLTLAVGIGVGYGASILFHEQDSASASSGKKEPLYWVAPMDPNYKRDQPGKSPMGMDLIPVYEEESKGDKDLPGTVKIESAVVNNLGVKTAKVTQGHLSPQFNTVGYVGFDESRLWQLNLRVSGWIEKSNVHSVGEVIKKGDPLFRIYSPELVNAQDELVNAIRSGRDVMIRGAKDRLLSLGMDTSQISQVLKTGKTSRLIDIKAVESGIVATLNVREGGYVTPNSIALSAGPIDKVWVNTEIFERQSKWVASGTEAVMTLSSVPGAQWSGTVDYVYPIIDNKTRTQRVRLVFDNKNGDLKPNMFANIVLKPKATEPSLLIPSQSVIHSGSMTRVVLDEGEGKFRSARIDIGREANGMVEVLEGLNKDDSIVTSAQFLIDSESSLSADLSRINGRDEAAINTVWAVGEITKVMQGHRMLTISHQPVKEWNWPGMVMDFSLSPQVDWQDAMVGQRIDFEIEKSDNGQYQIVSYKLGDMASAQKTWVSAKVTMVMPDFGILTIEHQPIAEFGWDAGEMNFTVNDLDLSKYKEGDRIKAEIEKNGSEFTLTQLKMAEDE
ncbi:efflux RND transporter periplasmic adaptor subunit [Vibrio sp.]|nr:efflux RND transporter periplasmic adaptor subunit [Vibrio sp.]